jgi:hypothetical protein
VLVKEGRLEMSGGAGGGSWSNGSRLEFERIGGIIGNENRKRRRMNSKKLGIWSLALSGVSVVLILTMWLLPGILFLVLLIDLAATVVCSVGAARQGSKLWLLASIWPVLHTVTLCFSIFAE